MLGPFLRTVLRDYDEESYRIAPNDYDEVIAANARFEEPERLDVRIPRLSSERVVATLRAAKLSVPKEAVVVDLCCGTGFIARSLIAAELTSRVVGIDLSGGQLAILKKVSDGQSDKRPRLMLVQANTMDLPIATGSVDLIIGNSFLHHLPDVGAALREIRRTLKPGGRFVALHEPSETSTFFESFPLSVFKTIVVRNYTDLWQFSADDLERLLRSAGFGRIRICGTGVLSNSLLGAASIIANKYLGRADSIHAWLQRVRGRLNAFEYRFSLKRAPSLLIEATNAATVRESAPVVPRAGLRSGAV